MRKYARIKNCALLCWENFLHYKRYYNFGLNVFEIKVIPKKMDLLPFDKKMNFLILVMYKIVQNLGRIIVLNNIILNAIDFISWIHQIVPILNWIAFKVFLRKITKFFYSLHDLHYVTIKTKLNLINNETTILSFRERCIELKVVEDVIYHHYSFTHSFIFLQRGHHHHQHHLPSHSFIHELTDISHYSVVHYE